MNLRAKRRGVPTSRALLMNCIIDTSCFGRRRRTTVVVALALLLAANAAAAQQPPEPAARATHDIWIMSTRCLGHPCCEAQGAEVAVWQRTGPSDWERRRLKDFYAQPADMPVAFFIYGNNIETDEVFTRGWDTLQALLPESSSPIRFVIWSWPSDRIRGPVQNVRRKADRTEIDSYYLARVLARMPAGREVSILAYSFGGRLATGALHLAAGGNLSCVSLDEAGAAPTVRLVLIAPAMHNYWLNPGAYHGRAASLWSELLVLYNPCDSVLRFYRFLDRRNRPAALGYTGSSHYLPQTRPGGRSLARIAIGISCLATRTSTVSSYRPSGFPCRSMTPGSSTAPRWPSGCGPSAGVSFAGPNT